MEKWAIVAVAVALLVGVIPVILKKIPEWVGWVLAACSIGLLIYAFAFHKEPIPPPSSQSTASSKDQQGGITAGQIGSVQYNQHLAQKAVDKKEEARKKKIREDLTKFKKELRLLARAVLSGWRKENYERFHVNPAIGKDVADYLGANYDASAVDKFLSAEPAEEVPGDLRTDDKAVARWVHTNIIKAQIAYLDKLIDEAK